MEETEYQMATRMTHEVEESLKRRGALLVSRQIQATISMMARHIYRLEERIEELEKRA